MTIFEHNGVQFSVRFYTHEELVKIDEVIGHTGASQEAGFYFDDVENGKEFGAPAGPFANEAAARAAWILVNGDPK